MSKEQLEEIKKQLEESNSYDDNPNGYWYNAINWLIEQAERVRELELKYGFKESQKGMRDALYDNLKRKNKQLKGNLSVYKGYYNNTLKHNNELIEQNKRYREVLEFYADEENYEFETIVSDCDIEVVSKVLDDYGQKARKALECEG